MVKQSMKKRERVNVGGGHMGQMGPGEKAKDFWPAVKKLVRYMFAFRWHVLVVMLFAIGSTVFAIASPKLLGNATNQIVDDYVAVKAYDMLKSKLPSGISLPAGTTGETLLAQAPNRAEIEQMIPPSQLEKIRKLDITQRPQFHFEAIWQIVAWLLGLYVLSALLRYVQTWIMTSVTQSVTFRMRREQIGRAHV